MGIRIVHQGSPGIAGIAGYKSGLGSAKERRRKQQMALYAKQQEMQFGRQMQLERLGIQARVRQGLQQAGFKHDAGVLKDSRKYDAGVLKDSREYDAGVLKDSREYDAGLQEDAQEERRGEADLTERRREAERARDRREAERQEGGREYSDQDRAKDNNLLGQIEDIEKDRGLSKEDREATIAKLEEQRQRLYDKSPKKPTPEEILEGKVGREYIDKYKPYGLYPDKDGNPAFPGGKVPELPEETRRELEQDRAKAEYEESIVQYKAADQRWEDQRGLRKSSYEHYAKEAMESGGDTSRAAIMAKVNEDHPEKFGLRPAPPSRFAPGGQQAGGQGAGAQQLSGQRRPEMWPGQHETEDAFDAQRRAEQRGATPESPVAPTAPTPQNSLSPRQQELIDNPPGPRQPSTAGSEFGNSVLRTAAASMTLGFSDMAERVARRVLKPGTPKSSANLTPVQRRMVAAAKNGDPEAQKIADERGIPWRQ